MRHNLEEDKEEGGGGIGMGQGVGGAQLIILRDFLV